MNIKKQKQKQKQKPYIIMLGELFWNILPVDACYNLKLLSCDNEIYVSAKMVKVS